MQAPGFCKSRLDKGYLFCPVCETNKEQKLQTFLKGSTRRKYWGTQVLNFEANSVTDLQGKQKRPRYS
jgi:hypothetical protein